MDLANPFDMPGIKLLAHQKATVSTNIDFSSAVVLSMSFSTCWFSYWFASQETCFQILTNKFSRCRSYGGCAQTHGSRSSSQPSSLWQACMHPLFLYDTSSIMLKPNSVVLVSIIWVVVLSELEASDVTCIVSSFSFPSPIDITDC